MAPCVFGVGGFSMAREVLRHMARCGWASDRIIGSSIYAGTIVLSFRAASQGNDDIVALIMILSEMNIN